jgi:MtN3 and saliva related transmembrane protein
MFAMITGGIFLWLIYGIMLESPSLIIANAATLGMSSTILFMKIKHG